MKLLGLIMMLSALNLSAQDTTYNELMASTTELSVTDSLQIKIENWSLQKLDTHNVKRWFAPLLGSVNNNRLKNRSYFLIGKITRGPQFDLIVLLEEKKKMDTVESQVVHLITTKKQGAYIASLAAAVSGIKKHSSFHTTSWVYPDLTIKRDSRITVNERNLNDIEIYKINTMGRFVMNPRHN